eukprot:CAMPEP_0198649656 /NCGR_PEP_ID=MMETSP1467-20131203/4416_1 /TAXON_ID=1462469 /ORGANISM="unid. sp., Strain CCMP2135" /LENGTH=1063 /DNA_ID=CAMNT_0044385453 /DNA_START=134 /DNA_END=3327 /DNA_ORIENTATION=+
MEAGDVKGSLCNNPGDRCQYVHNKAGKYDAVRIEDQEVLSPKVVVPRSLRLQEAERGAEVQDVNGHDPSSLYRDTVLLPNTNFSQRANAVVREPKLQHWWNVNQVYERLLSNAPGPPFVLHDGPPYANGDLHIGHALNKILKDFINRYRILRGNKVQFIPGWDCHGLPIELKVLQAAGKNASETPPLLEPLQLRARASAFAKDAMSRQRESFKRYGVCGSWDEPYLTLNPEYEAAQLGVFAVMFERGHIYRGTKPVWYSPSSQTALAEAELEYSDAHISRAVYATFDVVDAADCIAELRPLQLAIWTTTPWTLPANLAVAVSASLEYAAVDYFFEGKPRRRLVVAKALAQTLATKQAAQDFQVLATFNGLELSNGTSYVRPIVNKYGETADVIIGGDYISEESGTGLVHTAPGHGLDDYETGLQFGLNPFSPVDEGGRYTAEAGHGLEGLDVLNEAVGTIVQRLQNNVLCDELFSHRYPYDWRTKKPVLMRATSQWFASISTFREVALEKIDLASWVPSAGKNRIAAMISLRGDWCISRQRSWGVPIPVFYHKKTGRHLLTAETIRHVQDLVREHGSDVWWSLSVQDLLPACLRDIAEDYEKGSDTMDVWFDSGTSWASVLDDRLCEVPADLYLEGSDQHRGWFQSSLLTSVAVTGKLPFASVITHGFVLDENGFKMSKSEGNVIDPRVIIEGSDKGWKCPAYGADVLRMWVASVDYSTDVRLGENALKQVFEQYRKLRNTLRYMLGNIHDLSPSCMGGSSLCTYYSDLPSLDKWILGRLGQLEADACDAYEGYHFSRVVNLVAQFCVADLSAFYLDVAKDRLYISPQLSRRRRDCQRVIAMCLEVLTRLIAPLLPHLAEEAWHEFPHIEHMPYSTERGSVFELADAWDLRTRKLAPFPSFADGMWSSIRLLRNDINKALELGRKKGIVGSSLDSCVFIAAENEALAAILKRLTKSKPLQPHSINEDCQLEMEDSRFLFLTSDMCVVDTPEQVALAVRSPEHVLSLDQTQSGSTIGVVRPTYRSARVAGSAIQLSEGRVSILCCVLVATAQSRTGRNMGVATD